MIKNKKTVVFKTAKIKTKSVERIPVTKTKILDEKANVDVSLFQHFSKMSTAKLNSLQKTASKEDKKIIKEILKNR